MEQKTYALGQRYIGAGQSEGTIILNEVPGNALGAYLDGANIIVNCSAQDATGDTMNAGEITIHGSTGDAAGYAMRGGAIYVQGDAGYRAGIHMKEYKEKVPVLVIGGRTGSFLGEYQAGGIIVVLGIGSEDRQPVGNFCGTDAFICAPRTCRRICRSRSWRIRRPKKTCRLRRRSFKTTRKSSVQMPKVFCATNTTCCARTRRIRISSSM